MPIRPALKPLYPRNWTAISAAVRFGRARGRCEHCARPHGQVIACLPDGRWQDSERGTWRDGRGRLAREPDLFDHAVQRTTKVVLAAAHRDHDPRRNGQRNLKALCQRCHLAHDRTHHRWQRWLTWRKRYAVGDLFLGLYADLCRRTEAAAVA